MHCLPHRIDRMGGDQIRVTYAPPVVLEVALLGEHTDFSGITVLFNQLGSLQTLNLKDAETLHQTRGTEGVGKGQGELGQTGHGWWKQCE
jgi:hypothetical protein